MASLAEARRTLEGSIALARRDPDASSYFDLSADSFWRSFGAIVFIAPLYLVFVAAEARMLAESDAPAAAAAPSGLGLFTAELLTLGIGWFAYPLAMYFVTRLFGLGNRFVAYVIVYNWSSILVTLVVAPPFLLYALGLVPLEGAILLNLVTFVAAIVYRWMIATEVLGAPGITAAGFVALDVALGLVIDAAVASAFMA